MAETMLSPSAELTQALGELRDSGLDGAGLAARTGELVARYDREWQLAHNAGQNVDQAVTDFLTAVLVHVESLAATGQAPEALTTLLFGLLSVDISKADTRRFEGLHIRALYTLVLLLISMGEAMQGNPGVAEHLEVSARYALELFRRNYARHLREQGAHLGDGMNELYGQAADADLQLPPIGGEPVDALGRPGDMLVDIFTRMRACGISTV